MPDNVEWTAPTVEAVSGLIRTRTSNASGVETGVFGDDTTPTADQVDELIATAVSDMAAVIGFKIGTALDEAATSTATTLAAMKVELSYFPVAVSTGRSPYEFLESMYERQLAALVLAVEQAADDETVGAAAGANAPAFSFPDANDRLGLGTQW